MPVKSIARGADQLVTAGPETPVRELARLLREGAVGSVIIVDESETPVGIVTDRDLALEVINRDLEFDTPAKEVMTRDPVTVEGSEGVFEMCETMKHNKVRRMPVVEDGTLVGIVTLDDLVVLLQDEMEDVADVIRSEAPPY
jgi:signal-transduction protein with cAMP-binding, CBS, and nucleotidyltransferase domain